MSSIQPARWQSLSSTGYQTFVGCWSYRCNYRLLKYRWSMRTITLHCGSATMPDDYNLPRHTGESTRLDVQHEAYVKIIGYLFHPRIKAAPLDNARIADGGTGTGVGLQELARSRSPSWTFHGFDLSDVQFPQNGRQDQIAYERLTGPGPYHLELMADGQRHSRT